MKAKALTIDIQRYIAPEYHGFICLLCLTATDGPLLHEYILKPPENWPKGQQNGLCQFGQ